MVKISLAGRVGIDIARTRDVSDRRTYQRYRLTEVDEGTLRVFPDAIVEPHGEGQWIAVGHSAAVAGETLILDIAFVDPTGGEVRHRLPVCVLESRPIIVDGDVRHRLLLHGGALAPVRFEQQIGRG